MLLDKLARNLAAQAYNWDVWTMGWISTEQYERTRDALQHQEDNLREAGA